MNDSPDTGDDTYSVIVVGGGVAGLTAGMYTARHGMETLVIDSGDSILRRNAHLENYPGFPAGINPRLLLDMIVEQAEQAGCERRTAEVTQVEQHPFGFAVETTESDRYTSKYVIVATKHTTDYLENIEGVGIVDRGKTFVDTDEHGRTGVDGLYAAGRLAEKPHQAIVAAGHGAEVAVTLLEDVDEPFYHDWVAPEGYFTDRGYEVFPGCEEIDELDREDRETKSLATMRAHFAEPHPDQQQTHPSLEDE